MFAKIARPSSTAATIEAKLSSASTMSAASFETSVPVIPIATPMSAFFRAGASLTPSPVMATTAPDRRSASTIRSLCSGFTRAYTETSATVRASASGASLSNSEPVIARPSVLMPSSLRDDSRRSGMVSGDHHGANAGTPRAHDRVLCLGTRGIDDAYQSYEREVVLETFVRMRGLFRKRLAREPPAGDAERSQRLAREGFVGLKDGVLAARR